MRFLILHNDKFENTDEFEDLESFIKFLLFQTTPGEDGAETAFIVREFQGDILFDFDSKIDLISLD